MSAWHACLAGWLAVIAVAVATIGSACWGIWAGDSRGLISLVLLPCACIGLFVMGLWSTDDKPDRPTRLSRSDRQRLRDEARRIHVDAEIRRMEQEAGL